MDIESVLNVHDFFCAHHAPTAQPRWIKRHDKQDESQCLEEHLKGLEWMPKLNQEQRDTVEMIPRAEDEHTEDMTL